MNIISKQNINFVELSLEDVYLSYTVICISFIYVIHIFKNFDKQNNQKIKW